MSKVNCKGLTYDDCELAIMRSAIDNADRIKGSDSATSSKVLRERFLFFKERED